MSDHRSAPRRRGDALVTAILDATLGEIADHGYAALTMDQVARRAGASKASLYRRWPSPVPLVVDAVYHALPTAQLPDEGSLRADVLGVLRQVVRQLDGPAGSALRGLHGDALRDPAVAEQIHRVSRGNALAIMTTVVDRAVARGECHPESVTTRRLEAGPALVRHHFLMTGTPPSDGYLVEVVDEVVLRLFTGRD